MFYYFKRVSIFDGVEHYYRIKKMDVENGETFLDSLHICEKNNIINIVKININDSKLKEINEDLFKNTLEKTIKNLQINKLKYNFI